MANEVREILASYQDAEDLITIGAYKPGQNVRVDRAVQKIEKVQEFLRQRTDEREPIEKCWLSMGQILQG
jgi:flagellum-specific ATP synthase